jgi:glycosyltransferase involved in cell wall biosynthesis
MGDQNEEPTVAILMATYNGENYIADQLLSIGWQTYKNWHLYVSDDGSKDSTLAIVQAFSKLNPGKVTILSAREQHSGACGNFFRLIRSVPHSYNFYAFADQDDVWFDDKLETSIKFFLDDQEKECLVVCDCCVVDESLNIIKKSFIHNIKGLDPESAKLSDVIARNWLLGASMVLNKKLFELVSLANNSNKIVMHDFWITLVATALGTVHFVDEPLYCYRQHGENYVGSMSIRITTIPKKAYLAKKALNKKEVQAKYFLEIYGEYLTTDQQDLCSDFAFICQKNKVERVYSILHQKISMGDVLSQGGLIIYV